MIEVSDTGPGIAQDEHERIFEPFAQSLDGPTAGEGTGLGLSISRRFAALLGGSLAVRSAPGAGATFTLRLPVAPADAPDAPAATATRPPVGIEGGPPEIRVLIVDDTVSSRLLLRRLLAPLGFLLCEAGDGDEAVAAWRAWRPQLVLMDVRMPGIDGHEAARRIIGEAGAKPPAFILLTASVEREQLMPLGLPCSRLLPKPFHEAALFAAIADLLDLRYVYAEPDGSGEGLRHAELPAEKLATIPAALRRVLEEALISGNPEAIVAAIAAIERHSPALAGAIAALADDFAFRQLLELLWAAQATGQEV
jgi:CheY-like chemotaxis protein